MKIVIWCKIVLAFLVLLAVQASVIAGSITNNFNNSLDYTVHGVTGTMWDGIYLGFGDVPGGNNGGDGNGATSLANETANAGFLTVQTTSTSWAGAGDDGFFLFKVVAGDFDVSVENVEPFANTPYHFGGLLVRAFTTNGPAWGAPFSTTSTNASENWLNITRFNEFSVGDQIRYATNATDVQISAPYNSGITNYNGETADNRYFRITRTGDIFTFYDKTNQADAWVMETNIPRADLHGIPMQVGIEDATFSTATPSTFYTDFELTGTNVNASVTPPADPTGLTASVSGNNAVTYSWTPGAGSSGSVLVIRKNNPLVFGNKPINGFNYNASTNFSGGDNLGGGIYAVYVGTGSSAKITSLGSIVDTNYAAVYSYTGSGSSIVYGTNPATAIHAGPAPIVGVTLSLFPTNIPVNGGAVAQVTVAYGDGSTTVNPASGVTLSSGNPSVAVAGSGVVSGLAVGTAAITASYAGFSATNSVLVNVPAYADNFGTAHNYLAAGLPGSSWDGLYLSGSDIPNASYSPPLASTTVFDANITTNNALTITAANSGWQGASDNGPFLFKNVPGDFEASIHITDYSIVNYEFVGLQARAYSATDNSSPNGPGFAENFLDWLRFDEFGISTSTFNTQNGGNTENDDTDSDTTDYWLLMTRVNGTNFYCYKKANLTDPWILMQTIVRPDFTNGVPLQVGPEQSMFTGTFGSVQFDSFSLDGASISGGTPPSPTTGLTTAYDATNNLITLTWVPGTNGDGSASTSFVVMRRGAPVSAQPYFGILTSANSIFGQGTDLGGGNYLVFRGVGNTVTVSGLTAGAVYYAAVYGYSGSGTTKSFNEAGSASGSIQAGSFTGITASLSAEIPLGGVGLPKVLGLTQGGGTVDVSRSALLTSGNTNVIAATNGVLTGLAIGSATNTVTFVSGTNVFTTNLVAIVRAPTFTDNFSASHDYHANGVTNTAWDGVYEYPAFTIPDTTFVSDPAANVFSADANMTSNNVLTITSENVGWENAQDDGFFLFKYAPSDFQVAVHITTSLLQSDNATPVANYNYPGLLARPYSVDTNGIVGAPLTTNGDSFVTWSRFDEFGIGTRAELIINNGTRAQPSADVSDGQLWLLMVRRNSTNFYFYQRANVTDPWQPGPAGQTFSVTNFAGQPMQVGIAEGGFDSGNVVTAQFDSFMLDVQSQGPKITASGSGGNISLSWPESWPGGSLTLQSTVSLTTPSWQAVTVTPVVAGGMDTVTLPATNSAKFFRLVQ